MCIYWNCLWLYIQVWHIVNVPNLHAQPIKFITIVVCMHMYMCILARILARIGKKLKSIPTSVFIIKYVHIYITLPVKIVNTLCHWLISQRNFCSALRYLIGSFLPRCDSVRRMCTCPRPQIVGGDAFWSDSFQCTGNFLT